MTMQHHPGPHGRPPPPGARPPQQGPRPGAPPIPIPAMQAHFDVLIEQGEHALVGAAEILLEHLKTAMVVTRARFPELPPGTPEFRGVVLNLNEQLLRLSTALEEAGGGESRDDGQGGEGPKGEGYAPEGAELPAGDDGQGGESDGFDE